MDNKPTEGEELNSLEDPGTTSTSLVEAPQKKAKRGNPLAGLISHINIYVLLFILIVIIVSGFTFASFQRNKKIDAPTTIDTLELTAEDLQQLSGTSSSVGDPKQTLTVESNAIFNGKVLVRDSLDVAGTIKVGGALSLAGLSVSGTSSFDQIQGNRLAIAGDAIIQGQLSVQKGLTIAGGATFGGPISAPAITVQSFQVTGDLQITRHIDAGGGTPGKVNGSALGGGGTSSLSGNDTAGSITINTGNGPAPGCFITVNFTQSFSAVPHVVVTPVGSAGAALDYYVTRTASSFALCSTNAAPAGANFGFDYIVID